LSVASGLFTGVRGSWSSAKFACYLISEVP
jgi:hypothetical protein